MRKKHLPKGSEVKQYVHDDKKRKNNPPVGLVTAETDLINGKKTYEFDPHLDPNIQWSGKIEGTTMDINTISLHVHERIDPLTIIESVKRKEFYEQQTLFRYFESSENNPPIRDAIEFYKHSLGWTNRLIAGDSLLVMNSLLEKEGFAEKVQMIYIDPPYGIKYGSNFQPFVNKNTVEDGKDEDLTSEPEMIKAFRDTWELGVHSYLTYLRNRLLLSHQLLTENGSIFVQISEENVHHIREILDEIFGSQNFISQIAVKRITGFAKKLLNNAVYYVLWYSKNKDKIKYHPLFVERTYEFMVKSGGSHVRIESPDGKEHRRVLPKERNNIDKIMNDLKGWRMYELRALHAQGTEKRDGFEFEGKVFYPPDGLQWKTSLEGLKRLRDRNRLEVEKDRIRSKFYIEDSPIIVINSLWEEIGAVSDKIFAVQTPIEIIKRCMLMTTDPGDLVFDPTCGSGTTAFVAEQWGRRWITTDTSRVAITITKQRLMTSLFEYYELAYPAEGVKNGFKYKTVPNITVGALANNELPRQEILYDVPLVDKSKKRVSGPFTLEAVPFQRIMSMNVDQSHQLADMSIVRSGETAKENDWIDELLVTGIRGKGNQKIEFLRIEPLLGTRWIHADGETKDGLRVIISFGPEYAALEQRQVQLAIQEAQSLVPTPKIVIFVSFQFDPEASKDIDELKWPGVNVLKVQMNIDLMTSDLKKKRSSNESFWLIGQPDVDIKKQDGKYVITVNGFDYYNTKTGEIESGDISKIAVWELDTDYDGRSIYPRQVFFPMAGLNEGWSKLAKSLNAYIDVELIETFKGSSSLPFNSGKNKQIAVKIIDDRGIESLKIIKIKE